MKKEELIEYLKDNVDIKFLDDNKFKEMVEKLEESEEENE